MRSTGQDRQVSKVAYYGLEDLSLTPERAGTVLFSTLPNQASYPVGTTNYVTGVKRPELEAGN
jgi:hypothetical protein